MIGVYEIDKEDLRKKVEETMSTDGAIVVRRGAPRDEAKVRLAMEEWLASLQIVLTLRESSFTWHDVEVDGIRMEHQWRGTWAREDARLRLDYQFPDGTTKSLYYDHDGKTVRFMSAPAWLFDSSMEYVLRRVN